MNTIKETIIFRADGNSTIGLGHLVRSSALASMLQHRYCCILATRCQVPQIIGELKSTFSEVIFLPEQLYLSEAQSFEKLIPLKGLVVLDGYSFNADYQECLVKNGRDLFSIDDIHAFRFYSKVIFNHSGGFGPSDYQSYPSTQYYLGPRFALLRTDFLEAARTRRNTVTDNNCFVCFGGADPNNHTLQILSNKHIIDRFETLHVVTGSAYQYKSELEQFAKHHSNVILHSAATPQQMVSIMQQCSYAICSPSTILYEYLSVGGIVFLEQIADNQKDVISYFVEEGMAFPLSRLQTISNSEIEASFEKQQLYFDAKSGDRIRKVFQQYFDGCKLTLRKAGLNDLAKCYEWANDPEVREQSYNQNSISLEDHTNWFQLKLADSSSYFYIIEKDDTPVAQIRFQVTGGEAVLGYLADRQLRAKGMGTTILAKGIEAFINDFSEPITITGYVKESNIASQRSFERLAFAKEKTTVYPASYKYTMKYGNYIR